MLLRRYKEAGRGCWRLRDIAYNGSKKRWTIDSLLGQKNESMVYLLMVCRIGEDRYELYNPATHRYYMVKIYDPDRCKRKVK